LRAVGQAASDLWGAEWGCNQLFGEDLCVAAAKLLGEIPLPGSLELTRAGWLPWDQ
jgi:hypothetical protein